MKTKDNYFTKQAVDCLYWIRKFRNKAVSTRRYDQIYNRLLRALGETK